ncbi:MAG: hypothetical protein J7641_15905 [Cyanobacteria bacterium SID2]|nr:hypothetical protein [Cyanobacteria bacterium SID2]MBP0006070.1 hypothetical protein [Cyanobacteria bacterium SBC]
MTIVFRTFLGVLLVTLVLWILRGVGLLTFIQGGVLWLGIFLSIAMGILTAWQNSKRW